MFDISYRSTQIKGHQLLGKAPFEIHREGLVRDVVLLSESSD